MKSLYQLTQKIVPGQLVFYRPSKPISVSKPTTLFISKNYHETYSKKLPILMWAPLFFTSSTLIAGVFPNFWFTLSLLSLIGIIPPIHFATYGIRRVHMIELMPDGQTLKIYRHKFFFWKNSLQVKDRLQEHELDIAKEFGYLEQASDDSKSSHIIFPPAIDFVSKEFEKVFKQDNKGRYYMIDFRGCDILNKELLAFVMNGIPIATKEQQGSKGSIVSLIKKQKKI